MKGFYENSREENKKITVHRNTDYRYPLHFHRNLEIMLLKKGRYEILVNGEKYEISDGQIAVADSYDAHAYLGELTSQEPLDGCVMMIPYDYLHAFNAKRKNLRVAHPVVTDEKLCEELLLLVDRYLIPEQPEQVKSAAIDLLLSLLYGRLQLTSEERKNEVLLVKKLLSYIYENFRDDVSRGVLARAVGCTETHVSRVFHRYFNCGITEYVNGLRLKYIEKEREKNGEKKVIDLIYESGFKSPQTYYRVKKNLQSKQK